jgi:hypothetical protein
MMVDEAAGLKNRPRPTMIDEAAGLENRLTSYDD